MKKTILSILTILTLFIIFTETSLAKDKPNILVIWGDDVGMTNISAYSRGLMGYETPNIDRIANEGALFTDYYAEQTGNLQRRRCVKESRNCVATALVLCAAHNNTQLIILLVDWGWMGR